jgi:hypothetical protein
MHLKIDLLTDEQLAADTVKAGDILTLIVPGSTRPSKEMVESREESDAGNDPNTGEHLTRVTLYLNTVSG